MKRRHLIITAGASLAAPALIGGRANAQSASALGSTLTPVGADPKASADGLVPAWTGGITTAPAGWRPGDSVPNLYPDDQPIFTVTPDNMAKYDSMLCEGQRQMLKRYGAAGFRMKVYPSRRSFAAPQYVYDNTAKNVTRARPSSRGLIWGFEGAVGGVPFPIPSSDPNVAGIQIMRNHLTVYKGVYLTANVGQYICSQGTNVLTLDESALFSYPYYFEGVTPENYSGLYLRSMISYLAPPNQAGGKAAFQSSTDLAKLENAGFEYLVGEGRIRQAPQVQYDVPFSQGGDAINNDEINVFNGAMDRYNWKLVGKKQMIVMYNSYGFYNGNPGGSLYGTNFVDPEETRWEVHRCHVIEATLAPGKRHTMPHRCFYVDEDTWQALMSDGWDEQGNYWRFGNIAPAFLISPEGPAPFITGLVTYNLQSNQYFTTGTWVNGPSPQTGQPVLTTPIPAASFDPSSMMASGSL